MTEQLHFHFSLSCIAEGNETHFNVLAWRIPGTGETGGLPSLGLHRVGHDWSDLEVAAAASLRWIFLLVNSSLKWIKVKVTQSCPALCDPMDYTVYGILQDRILEWVAFLFSRGSSQPRDGTQVSLIASGFFTSWATREAQEYCSGSLSLLLPTQESNRSLLHCRRILYQLSHQGSPYNG